MSAQTEAQLVVHLVVLIFFNLNFKNVRNFQRKFLSMLKNLRFSTQKNKQKTKLR